MRVIAYRAFSYGERGTLLFLVELKYSENLGGDECMGFIEDYVDEVENELIEESKKKVATAMEEFFSIEIEKTKELYHNVIDDFYDDVNFERKMYIPRGTMHSDAFAKFTTNGKRIDINFHPEVFVSRTGYSGEDGLFKTVFEEGWHGGKRGKSGDMKYPIGKFKKGTAPYYYNGVERPYDDIKYGWSPAVRADISPYDDFIKRWDNLQDTVFEKDLNEIISKYFDML